MAEAGQPDAEKEALLLQRTLLSETDGGIWLMSVEDAEELRMLKRWVTFCT
jgi:hypothetical protein